MAQTPLEHLISFVMGIACIWAAYRLVRVAINIASTKNYK
jgi:hypothetical protein